MKIRIKEKEKQLNYTIAVNNGITQTANVNAEAESAVWKENVLRGYSMAVTKHVINSNGNSDIKIELKNKNLVINQIEIYKVQ